MKLIERMLVESPSVIEGYLRELANQAPEQLLKELTECNIHGMTPLHIAIGQANLAMVKVLLSFGAPLATKPSSIILPPEQYAQTLAQQYPHRMAYQQVYALIISRGRWQGVLIKSGLSLQRILHILENTLENLQDAKDQNGILFLGVTGEGKSTLVNYLYGIDYRRDVQKGRRRLLPMRPEVVVTSDSTTSATLLPRLVLKEKLGLLDLPGFEDTRGTAEEICAAFSTCLFTKQLRQIQAMLLVVSWGSLAESRMLNYRRAAESVGAMLSLDARTMENLILVVTKPEADLKEEDVRARLQTLYDTELSHHHEIKESDLSGKAYLHKVTQAILKRSDSVLIVEPSELAARARFLTVLGNLTTKGHAPNRFDFKHYNRFMPLFERLLTDLANYFITLDQQEKIKQKELEKINLLIQDMQQTLQTQQHVLQELDRHLTPFDPNPYLIQIERLSTEIAVFKAQQIKLRDKIRSDEERYREAQAGYAKAKADYDRLFLQIKAQENEFARAGQLTPQMRAKFDDIVDDLDLMSALPQRKRTLDAIQTAISNARNEEWRISDDIRQHENLLAQQRMMLDQQKEVSDSKVAITQQQQKACMGEIARCHWILDEKNKEYVAIKQEVSLARLQFEVNRDLFVKIRTIITTLGLNNEAIGRFMRLVPVSAGAPAPLSGAILTRFSSITVQPELASTPPSVASAPAKRPAKAVGAFLLGQRR